MPLHSLSKFSPTALVFIDYDGVLQTSALPDFKDFEFLPAFEAILREFPGVGVGISSTHRVGFPLETLRKLYSPDIRHRIIGATPDLVEGRADGGRFKEIEAFRISEGVESLPWLAIDDEGHLFPPDCPSLLLTSRYGGFHEGVQFQLREWLSHHAGAQAPTPLP